MLFIKDIFNYFYILRQIKKMKLEYEWKELNLLSRLASIYTVRTINKEILGLQNENLRNEKIREYFEPVFAWLLKWNLQDVMIPEPLKELTIPNTYLLILRPNPKLLTMNYILALGTIITILTTVLYLIFF